MSTTLSAESIKKTIAYFYLLSFCPPAKIEAMKDSLALLRKQLAESAEMSESDYYKKAIPDVCKRIVAFHEDTREPSQHWVETLVETASKADKSSQDAYAFQEKISKVARLPQRALPDNRLHRRKGCEFCQLPCHYGFFTLVSDPDFETLQEMLEAEVNRDRETQSAIQPVWRFTFSHLVHVINLNESFAIHQGHIGNLSYCLLMLAMAKSRLALPEKQLKVYQAINQQLIQSK